jgi:acetyl esterase/lipase
VLALVKERCIEIRIHPSLLWLVIMSNIRQYLHTGDRVPPATWTSLVPSLLLLATTGCRSTTLSTNRTDIAYVTNGHERQRGDLYLPNSPGPHPTALVIHGGGWSARDRSDMARVCRQLARNGMAAFNANYRLAPEHLYPAQLEDVQAALRFLAANADRWHLDTDRFITVGYSAGGHLALLAAGKQGPAGPRIRAVVAGGAPVDFSLYPKSPYITKFIGGSPKEYPDAWQDASPIRYVDSQHPSVFLYHARWDRLVGYNNSQIMYDALRQRGVDAAIHTRIGGHLLVGAHQSPSIRRALPFLREHLSP